MKSRSQNDDLTRQRKRQALARSLRRQSLPSLSIRGSRRQFVVDAPHRRAAAPRGLSWRRNQRRQSLLGRDDETSNGASASQEMSSVPQSSPAAATQDVAPTSASGRDASSTDSGNDEAEPHRARRSRRIVAYGAAAIADGSRIVRVDADVDIAAVREGDRLAVDGVDRPAEFVVVSMGLHRRCLELDRPLSCGRYAWSIERDRSPQSFPSATRPGDAATEAPSADAIVPAPSLALTATATQPEPLIWSTCITPRLEPAIAPACTVTSTAAAFIPEIAELHDLASASAGAVVRQHLADTSAMAFCGRTCVERNVPRDPHLSNEANQLEGNEATFALWLNRTATVIRPETLMMAVDHLTGDSFTITLVPAVRRAASADVPIRFDLEVIPHSGCEARPVRWTVEHPRSAADWQFIALVTDRDGGVTMWLDGRQCGRRQSTRGIAHHDHLSLGDRVLGMGAARDGIEAIIPTGLRDTLLDSFAVWSRSLGAAELQTAMIESPLAATHDGSLQLYWRLSDGLDDALACPFRHDEQHGRRINDRSGTLRHGQRVTRLQAKQQRWSRLLDRAYQSPPTTVGAEPFPRDIADQTAGKAQPANRTAHLRSHVDWLDSFGTTFLTPPLPHLSADDGLDHLT